MRVCPGYTKTDFTNHIGGEVEEAAKRIIKYALLTNTDQLANFLAKKAIQKQAKLHGSKDRLTTKKTMNC